MAKAIHEMGRRGGSGKGSRHLPVMAVVVNGTESTFIEVLQCVRNKWPILVVKVCTAASFLFVVF
jgi:hypothetical protein